MQPVSRVLFRVSLFDTLGDGLCGTFVVGSVRCVEYDVGCGGFTGEEFGVVEPADYDADVGVGGADFVGFFFGADESCVGVFGMGLLKAVEGVAGDVAGYAGAE